MNIKPKISDLQKRRKLEEYKGFFICKTNDERYMIEYYLWDLKKNRRPYWGECNYYNRLKSYKGQLSDNCHINLWKEVIDDHIYYFENIKFREKKLVELQPKINELKKEKIKMHKKIKEINQEIKKIIKSANMPRN